MARKKTVEASLPAPRPPSGGLLPRGKAAVAAGGILAAAGFLLLSRADPLGRNAAAALSPWLILGGYAAVAWGLFQVPPRPRP